MTQPEESQEKTSKTDDILLKPVLKDLDELREGEGTDEDVPSERQEPERDQSSDGDQA